MNPSAPVTRTGTSRSDARQRQPPLRARAPSCSRWPTSIQSSSISNAPTGSPSVEEPVRSGRASTSARPARRRRDDGRVEGVDPGVDLALDGRLLLERDDPVAVALDAAERDRVEVAPDADRRAYAPGGVERRAGAPRSAEVTRSPFMTRSGSRRGAPAAGRARRPCRAGASSRRYSIRAPNARAVAEVVLDDVGRGS